MRNNSNGAVHLTSLRQRKAPSPIAAQHIESQSVSGVLLRMLHFGTACLSIICSTSLQPPNLTSAGVVGRPEKTIDKCIALLEALGFDRDVEATLAGYLGIEIDGTLIATPIRIVARIFLRPFINTMIL